MTVEPFTNRLRLFAATMDHFKEPDMSINASLHRPITMTPEDLGEHGGNLIVADDNGGYVNIFMPYPVAEAVARAFTEATAAHEAAKTEAA